MTLHLDRRVTESSTGVSVAFDGTKTTWTLPYELAVDGSEGVFSVVRDSTRERLTTTQESTNTVSVVGNYVGVQVHIGVVFDTEWEFSVIYRRNPNRNNQPDIRGRTNIRYLKLHYEDATSFSVVVTAAGRAARTYTFTSADPAVPESGVFHVPIQAQNTQVTIAVTSSGAGAASFSGYEWEGMVYQRVRNTR